MKFELTERVNSHYQYVPGLFCFREIAEAHLAASVSDWFEGNKRLAKGGAERALRTLVEGNLGCVEKDDASRQELRRQRRAMGVARKEAGVPVPLGLCVATTAMLIISTMAVDTEG